MSEFHSDFLWLVLGIGGVLVTASVIGYVLAWRYSPDGSNEAIENLNARIEAWWLMVILLSIAFMGGKTGVVILFAFCSFAALREFATLTNTRQADHVALAGAFFVVLPVQYITIGTGWYGFYSIFIPVWAFLLMPIAAALRGDTNQFLVRVAETQWALMICVFCASHVPALLNLDIPGYEGQNVLLIAFLVVVVQSSDVLQYVWGKLFGKTKVAPKLSPSKTLEGLIGGVLSATLIGASLWWLTPFTPLEAGALSLVITLMGFFRRTGHVRNQTRPRGQGLGTHDCRPRRVYRQAGFRCLLRPGLLPPGTLWMDTMTEPESRRPIASRNTGWARGLTSWLVRKGVTPNQISQSSMAAAAWACAAFYLAGSASGGWRITLLITAALFCQLRLICNLLDGMVAVEAGKVPKTARSGMNFPTAFPTFSYWSASGTASGNLFSAGQRQPSPY